MCRITTGSYKENSRQLILNAPTKAFTPTTKKNSFEAGYQQSYNNFPYGANNARVILCFIRYYNINEAFTIATLTGGTILIVAFFTIFWKQVVGAIGNGVENRRTCCNEQTQIKKTFLFVCVYCQ